MIWKGYGKMMLDFKQEKKSGMTLVEVMISMSVFSLLMAGLLSFHIFTLKTQAMTTGKLLISKDVRVFTQEFAREARGAGHWELYDNLKSGDLQANNGDTGDLVLFYFENFSTTHDEFIIYKVTGFYRRVDGNGEGPVIQFNEWNTWTSAADYKLPSYVGDTLQANNSGSKLEQDVVVELARGEANGNLFYNFANRDGIIIRGEIEQDGRPGQKAVNTYNFTVYPRG
jgi:prepilin-type N-terminal cleavage/methylation domain-containing protein